jgi:hypothetical protein
VHKFPVIENQPRELDVIDEAEVERAMNGNLPQFGFPAGKPREQDRPASATPAKRSEPYPNLWRQFAQIMGSGPMARDLDSREKKFFRADRSLKRKT